MEDDIYGNKRRYEKFVENYKEFAIEPNKRTSKNARKCKYWCKNKINLKYFEKLFRVFDAKDLSYIRRNRLLSDFKMLLHLTSKELKDVDRDEINYIVGQMRKLYKSPKSQSDFIKDLKVAWKILFPEKDDRGSLKYILRTLVNV